jgi:hypothetical protein
MVVILFLLQLPVLVEAVVVNGMVHQIIKQVRQETLVDLEEAGVESMVLVQLV